MNRRNWIITLTATLLWPFRSNRFKKEKDDVHLKIIGSMTKKAVTHNSKLDRWEYLDNHKPVDTETIEVSFSDGTKLRWNSW